MNVELILLTPVIFMRGILKRVCLVGIIKRKKIRVPLPKLLAVRVSPNETGDKTFKLTDKVLNIKVTECSD